jgi:putative ABC transport system permease protein
MPSLSLLRRLRGSARNAAFEREMAAELDAHIALEADALAARGMDPGAARIEAQRRFGSVAVVADQCRDAWGLHVVETFVHDARHAARSLLTRHRAHAVVVVVTLALGIGANTAIFSAVHAVLLRPLPYASSDALVEIRQRAAVLGVDNVNLSAPELADYRREAATLDAVVEYHQMNFNLLDSRHGRAPSRVVTGVVSAEFFDVLGVKPILGRSFVADDDRPDAVSVLIVSHAYWQGALGGDPNVIGRPFELNDRVHTVVGVLPAIPLYPDENDVYMPVSACPFRSAPHMEHERRMRMVSAIGRMRPGATMDAVRRDVAAVAQRMAASHPDAYAAGAGFEATALSIRGELSRRARPTLLLLLAASGFVLLLVCANVANLTLARLSEREHELSLRSALGAGRGRIARQLLTEAALLSGAGGVLGLAIAALANDLLVAYAARLTPRAAEIGLDPVVVAFTLVVTIATGLLFGVAPALRGSRPDARPRRARARQTLVAAQVAISFVLLVAAGLMARSFVRLQSVDAGFTTDRVLTARVDLDWVKYDSPAKRRTFFRPLLAKLRTQPGISHAALSLTIPLGTASPFSADFLVDRATPGIARALAQGDFRLVSPDYFETIGMTLLHGRTFTAGDDADAHAVAIVNLSMARHQFGSPDAVGRRVSLDEGRTWTSIVGVVNDVKQYGLDTAPVDELYLPIDQRGPLAARILVRTDGDPMRMLDAVERAVRETDPLQPISRVATLEQAKRSSLAQPRLTAELVSLLALLAVTITAIGIGAVAAISVSQRTFEIGVRMALGAPKRSVVALVIREALRPTAAGLAIGFAAALTVGGAVETLLFDTRPMDVPTYAAVVAALAGVAALACVVPARRAATVDPTAALRSL